MLVKAGDALGECEGVIAVVRQTLGAEALIRAVKALLDAGIRDVRCNQ